MASRPVVFRLRQHLGTIDHETLDWLLPLYQEYRGADADPKALDGMRAARALSAAHLEAGNINMAAMGIGLNLKTYTLPLLQSQVVSLGILAPSFQQQILDLY